MESFSAEWGEAHGHRFEGLSGRGVVDEMNDESQPTKDLQFSIHGHRDMCVNTDCGGGVWW